MQQNIIDFLTEKHIVSFSVFTSEDHWAASCFYVFDQENDRLILLTDPDTRHGKLMQQNCRLSGTIIHESTNVATLRGMQFKGEIHRLKTAEKPTALSLYYNRFPYAKLMPAEVWVIDLKEVKFVDNREVFGRKSLWSAAENSSDKETMPD